VNHDDPLLANWQQLHELGALDLRIMQNVGMEASAHWVWQKTNEILQQRGDGRNWCWKVEARENSKNAACWELLPPWALQ
jgi:6-pyruvoyltetrahydropterin/6-carboxytetrahydropterin synthase